MAITERERMSRAAWTRRIRRRVARGLTRMRKQKADGIRLVLLDEHNARDEQERFGNVAETVAREFRKRGLRTAVYAYETEQMGGQHMEWINHVTLEVLTRQPTDSHDYRRMRILEV